MARRKPKPTAVKKLEGNPGKRKMNTKTTRTDTVAYRTAFFVVGVNMMPPKVDMPTILDTRLQLAQ